MISLLYGQQATTIQHTAPLMPKLELVIESGDNQYCEVNSSPAEDLVMRIRYAAASEPPVKKNSKVITYPSVPVNVEVLDPDGVSVKNETIITDASGLGTYVLTAVDNPGVYHIKATINVANYPEFGFWNVIDYQINVIKVVASNIDATDPYNTVVNYRTFTTSPSIKFTAPGNVSVEASDISGDFNFSYNQEDLITGDNHLRLTTPAGNLDILATKSDRMQSDDLEVCYVKVFAGDIYTVPVIHEGYIFYHTIVYSSMSSSVSTIGKL